MQLSNKSMTLNGFIILSIAVSLTACGSSKTLTAGSNELQSRSGDEISSSSKTVAYCNKASTSTLSYKIMSQYTGSGYDPNWAHLKVYNTPAGFDTGSSYIQFWKAYASSDALIAYHNSPITFSIYDLQNGTYLKQNITALKWSDVSGLISGSTVSSFMSRVLFVLNLQDPNGQYTVFTATSYAASTNAVQDNVSALLPAFYANPADYATKAGGFPRETVLKNLHPFKNQSGDYSAMALALCQ